MRSAPGVRATPVCCGPVPWLISPPNLACTNRSRSIPVDSSFWPAITSRSASDLGIPLVGVGLFYGQGYFRQRLDRDGWQREEYLKRRQPTGDGNGHREKRQAGGGCRSIPPWSDLRQVWRVKVGRCDLFLLGLRRGRQYPEDRVMTSRLYGGDGRVRVHQELLLGVAACAL